MVDVKLLEKYIASGLNILVTGQAGTGKTTMMQQAAKNLGWNMKYYSTSTLDPFADLVGIPVPNMGRRTVDYFRPKELDEAEIVFFDELNRADLMVLNAVFEIIQFRSINGEKLDKLKCVVAAINPVGTGYATRELDLALRDRFDLFLEADPNPSWEYFKNRFGGQYAEAGFKLYNEYEERRSNGEALGYFSPRRLDKLLFIFQKFPVVDTIKGVVPEHGTIDFNDWAQKLGGSIGVSPTPIAEDLDDRIAVVRQTIRGSYFNNEYAKKDILKIYHMSKTAQHHLLPQLKKELILSLNRELSNINDLKYWRTFINDLSSDELTAMTQGWPEAKAMVARQPIA